MKRLCMRHLAGRVGQSWSMFVALLACSAATAAPTITGYSGTVADGQTIVISGSGFGAAGPTIVLYDSFEKGTIGADISTSPGSADIGNWSALASPVMKYSVDYAVSGTKSMRVNFTTWGSGPELHFPDVQGADLFLSFWQYMPLGATVPYEAPNYNWKWFWIGDSNDGWPWGSDYVTVCLSADCDSSIAVFPADDTAPPQRGGGTWYSPLFDKGEWMRVSVAMRNSTSDGYIWNQEIDGTTQSIPLDVTGLVTAHADDPWNVLTLPGFGHQSANATIYYDDVYVAVGPSARARVEIGDNAVYQNATRLSLATPTSWSATSITATVRAGPFVAGETVYLFVVDANGSASSGYPITLGGACTTNCAGRCGGPDGCGGICPDTCVAPETCGGGGTPDVCGQGACTPTTCAAEGFDCGVALDGCGGTLDCGQCMTPETCGGGTPNRCGCTPATCASLGVTAGSVEDGCGGWLQCDDSAGPGDTSLSGGCSFGTGPGGLLSLLALVAITCGAGSGRCRCRRVGPRPG